MGRAAGREECLTCHLHSLGELDRVWCGPGAGALVVRLRKPMEVRHAGGLLVRIPTRSLDQNGSDVSRETRGV